MDIGHPVPDEFPDVYRIVREQIGDEDAEEAAITLEGETAASDTWLVSRVNGQVAACLQMLEVDVRVGTRNLIGGSVEFVASDPAHEGKGLIRSLIQRFHEHEVERESLVQVIEGIPYFYRRFGYEYALPTPSDLVVSHPLPRLAHWVVRTATPDDGRLITDLQQTAQAGADVVVGHSARTWQWILRSPVYRILIASNGDRRAMARVCKYGETSYMFDVAGDQEGSLAIAADISNEGPLHVLRRPGSTDDIERAASIDPRSYARYGRIGDLRPLLARLLPELNRRIAPLELGDRTTAISHYGSSTEIEIRDGSIAHIRQGGRMQAVFSAGALGVPPDLVATLVLGPLGAEEMRRRHPDVIFDPSDPLWPALFPPQTIDVQTWVYP